ncbi:DUF2096 domain-containing protein [Methanobrevibacter olleyae]|uniref:DUF2096 domain-containing protein n=1 Tax=Methanobrevibacter olleyae TaxID=294671 RepID=A0A126QYT9_METOL|nr:DUF2096 domain-containing protein [Methanobrevibacter olleyae]AMK14967.1 hypothetical protein YLM1_0407 [Methanobrevibacter olleyae]SFL65399.1 hypothetical protein SAMN02910297_01431 [Methanobrevibacter olleyae]
MSTLPIERSWLVIVNLSTELYKKGIQIPNEINKDLGLVKSQIGFYKKDPSHPDMINEMAKADMSLNEIQGVLLSLAESYDKGFYEEWLDKLQRANKGEEIFKTPDTQSKFILNAPPGFSYAKITLKNPIAEDRVQEIAEYYGLIMEFDSDLTIALYGEKPKIQSALREMAPFFLE